MGGWGYSHVARRAVLEAWEKEGGVRTMGIGIYSIARLIGRA